MSTDLNQMLQLAGMDERPVLLVLGEAGDGLAQNVFPQACVLSNRLDVCRQAETAGWPGQFSDFDFGSLPVTPERIFYRLSKEKRVVEHILDAAWVSLPVGGEFWLAGFKNEGIKTFARRMESAWQCSVTLIRAARHLHIYSFSKEAAPADVLSKEPYTALQQVGQWQGQAVFSKPGIFAWNRIDEGSQYLLDHLSAFLPADCSALSGLDLGCGNGVLALALLTAGCGQVFATDNNAAAITAATHTLTQAKTAEQQVSVEAADCADSLHTPVDRVLCNPPFHQGFGVEQALTDCFLAATRRLLKPGGQALFVVNAFIPLEKKAAGLFRQVETLADNRQFRLITLTR